MNSSVIVSLLATLTLGGAAGAAVTHQVMANIQVTCSGPAARAAYPADFFKPTPPLPFTGKQY
jgi:hypothetical protein